MKGNGQMSDVIIDSIHTRQTPRRLFCRKSESRVCFIICTTNPPICQATELSCLSTLVRHCGYNDYQEPCIQQVLYPLIFKKKITVPPKVNFLGTTAGGRSKLRQFRMQGSQGWAKSHLTKTLYRINGKSNNELCQSLVKRHHSVVSSALNTENLISNNCLKLSK